MDQKNMQETDQDEKKKKRGEIVSTVIIVYFLAAFGITAYATDHHMLTYGQISALYLPMFGIFIYWQIQRLHEHQEGHTRIGNIIAIIMCIFIIVVTACVSIGSWTGMF